MFAAPLGIGLSRRGVLGGVAAAILLFFCLVFFSHLFLVLGQSQIVPAFVSAWATNVILLLIGIYLIYMRSNNRDLPKLKNLFTIFKSSPRLATAGASPAAPALKAPAEKRSPHRRSTHRSPRRQASKSGLDFD